jgi:hypothetical protein
VLVIGSPGSGVPPGVERRDRLVEGGKRCSASMVRVSSQLDRLPHRRRHPGEHRKVPSAFTGRIRGRDAGGRPVAYERFVADAPYGTSRAFTTRVSPE